MDYKDYTVVKKWDNVPTNEIINIRKSVKKVVTLNTEWISFYLFLFIFTLPSLLTMFTHSFGDSFTFFTINFIAYFFVWQFYIKKKVVDVEQKKAAEDVISEIDFVLKHR